MCGSHLCNICNVMMGDWQQPEVEGNYRLQKNHRGFVNIIEDVSWKSHY